MSKVLDLQTVGKTAVGAISVISGVVIKNSKDRLPADSKVYDYVSDKNLDRLGLGLFGGGWLWTAHMLSDSDWGTKSLLSFGASLMILVVVMMMKNKMKTGENVPTYLPVMFSMAWLLLGYSLGILRGGGFNKNSRNAGIFASVLVILSMLMVLPYQREHGIVDGPGMPMFAGAWGIISLVNALPTGL